MSNFSKNIRVIARTEELQKQIDQLLKGDTSIPKLTIPGKRTSSSNNEGSGVVTSSTEDPGTTNTNGINVSGDPVLGPPAPPPTNIPNSNSNNNTNPFSLFNPTDLPTNTNSTDNTGFGIDNKNTNNIANNAHETATGGSTGSPYANQAQRGANDTEIQNLVTAMTDRGATTTDINNAVTKAVEQELGVDDVSDVYNNIRGPQLLNSNNTKKETNRGFLGVDPDNPSKAIILRTDGYLAPPNSIDLATRGMSDWPDPNVAPIDDATFRTGYYWVGPIDGTHTVYAKTCTSIISAAETYSTSLDPDSGSFLGFVKTGETINEVNLTSPTDLITLYPTGVSMGAVIDSISDPWPNNYFLISGCGFSACPGSPGGNADINAQCFTGGPISTYSAYPVSGVATLTLQDGKVIFSEFDTEIPFKIKNQNMSYINILSQIDNIVYTISPTINGGYALYKQDLSGHVLIYGADNTLQNILPTTDILPFYIPRKLFL